MTEDEIRGLHASLSAIAERILKNFEQPTSEIAMLAESTFEGVSAVKGARRWDQGQLEKIVAAFNDHRRTRLLRPATTMWLLLILHDIAGLAEPNERVAESLRKPADADRVSDLLAEIRAWRLR